MVADLIKITSPGVIFVLTDRIDSDRPIKWKMDEFKKWYVWRSKYRYGRKVRPLSYVAPLYYDWIIAACMTAVIV